MRINLIAAVARYRNYNFEEKAIYTLDIQYKS